MTSETQSPTTATSSFGWVNPTNVVSSNNAYATYTNTGGTTVADLFISGFNFTKTGLVLGVQVEVEGKVTSSPKSFFCKLVRGSTVSATKSFSLGTSEAYVSMGGATDLWADVHSTIDFESGDLDDLQVDIWANSATEKTTSIDHVRVTMYYSQAATVTGAQPAATGVVVARFFAALAGAQLGPSGVVVPVFANKNLVGVQAAPSGLMAALTVNKQLAGAQPGGSGELFAGLTALLPGLQPAPSGSLRGLFENKQVEGNQPAALGVIARYLEVAKMLAGVQAAASGYVEGAFIRNPVKLPGGRAVAGGPRLSVGRAKAVRPGR